MENNTITLDRDNYERAIEILKEYRHDKKKISKIDEAICYLLDGEIREDTPIE